MMAKRWAIRITSGLALATALVGVALATPGSGVTGTVWARAGFADRVDLKIKVAGDRHGREVLHVPQARDTVVQQIVFGPGGHTGWHSHPGPVVVLVAQGELTLYSADDPACTGRIYGAGQAFIDSGQGHVHLGRASAMGNTVLWVTYFDVPPGSPFRLDAANPGTCAF